MKISYTVVLVAAVVTCALAAPSRQPGKTSKDYGKPTPATIYNGGKHNGQHNKGGINGLNNKGSHNGNYNTGGINGNNNGGSYNGNRNTGGGMNGNGNGGDREVDWKSFLNGLDIGSGYLKGTKKPSPARKTTAYATKNTTPAPTEKTTKNPYEYGYEKGYGPGDWKKYLSGGDDLTTASWEQDWGFGSDYWNNFNKQFQPGGKYHWSNYLPKGNEYQKYRDYHKYQNYGGW